MSIPFEQFELGQMAGCVVNNAAWLTHKDDTEVTRHACAVLPVQGKVREEFSPLLYHLFASYVASYVAARLGRSLFQSDRPELLQSVNEHYASLQQDMAR